MIHLQNKLRGTALMTAFFLASCSASNKGSKNVSMEDGSKYSEAEELAIYSFSLWGKNAKLGALEKASCDRDNPLVWRVSLNTAIGKYQVLIRPLEKSKAIAVSIDGMRYEVPYAGKTGKAWADQLCRRWEDEKIDLIWDKESRFAELIVELLNVGLSNCKKVEVSADGFMCRSGLLSPKQVKQRLSYLENQMLRRWTRQPYLLSRRIAIAKDLARRIQQKGNLLGICQVVMGSLQEELPLVMTVPKWKKAICSNDDDRRQNAGLAALRLAVDELELLHGVIERTSRLGILQLKIPRKMAPSKDLWVSLSPLKQVNESVAQATESLSFQQSKLVAQGKKRYACWHPIFGTDLAYLRVAERLGISEEISEDCSKDSFSDSGENTHPLIKNTDSYFASSIVGETEFIVSNWNSKILRLPVGGYAYKIYGLPKDVRTWVPSSSDETTAGQIKWSKRRPRPVIRTW